MTPGARFQEAVALLGAIAASDRPADGVASAFVRARRYMGSKDRRAVTSLAWGVLRCRARLTWHVERCDLTPTPRSLALAYLVVVEGQSAATVRALFAASPPGPHDPSPLTVPESGLVMALQGKSLEDRGMRASVRYEVPVWIPERLAPALGEALHAELEALLAEAPVDLRVNTLKATRDAAVRALADEGISATPGSLSPLSLRLEGRPHVAATRAFQDGLVEVQDEGSQLVALMAEVTPGMAVLDLCAGAGGKTLALAAAMENKGSLIATDVSAGRLERARVRLHRAGVHNVTCRVLDAETSRWLKRRKGSFDRVLIDAPCSGTGTWRRNPDARWRLTPERVQALVAEQAGLLERGAGLVKPGGRLVYATCSLLPEENEDRITAFLSAHPEYEPTNKGRRLLPGRDGTDGFFIAVLTRSS
ncbi:RsmB/NOP family class I SAM-dependent RNA methyltransferase [Pararhodospirillum photometricum]|uniref:tRNA/rRNA cytosine-C5-methylase n=1 Tax=Pararhodospirillum photometricum DSM 122 TaxID=1150469 RepID=H6SS15_PARPM|nr:RsmB/NOP family class I SAM-dependent RNA methyltransferase [Pararhodospirillum photometricum]CCG07694.1 tRNA/rRNA cytosine-C5-methylase [Pararhodospirillum photometricum DSM 122]